MNKELIIQLCIGVIPAIISGLISFFISMKQFKNEIKKLETNNKHEIEKLMKQHEVDINSLKEKHKMDLEMKDKEHALKIEEIKIQNEQDIMKKEKELSNSAMYSIMEGATKDIFKELFNSKDIQEEISRKVKESFNK